MSAPTLRIVLDARPLERVPARLAVVGAFEGERPLRGAVGRADWRLCGLLTELVSDGSLRGSAGEATLVGSSARLASEALLVVGLGPRAAFGAAAYESAIRGAFERVAGLAARSVVLGSFGLEGDSLVAHAGRLVDGALAGLGSHSAALALCVAEEEQGRLRRELVRCGRTTSVAIEPEQGEGPAPSPATSPPA